MKIRFIDKQVRREKEEYIIPISLILYLNEKYDDRDISSKILHYFLCYLSEVKNNKLLEEYRYDLNEIKIALNGLSNKDIQYNQKRNDCIVEAFCDFIKEKEIYVNLLIENIDEINYLESTNDYDIFCAEKLQKLENEKLIYNIDIIDDPADNKEFVQEVEDVVIDNDESEEGRNVSFRKIFSKWFGDSENISEKKIYTSVSPEYEWNQTSLRFKKPDGTWGKWVDLKGSSGKSGGGSKGMNREQVNELISYALDPLSGSNIKSHQLSSSYFSMSNGSVNNMSVSTLTVENLIAQNSNITGSTVSTIRPFVFFLT